MGKLLRMSWRNVWRNWRRTIIAVIAISLGLVLLLVFDGLMGGAEQGMYGNVVKLQGGNVQIHAPGYREKANRLPLLPLSDSEAVVQAALAQPRVVGASRRINSGGMVSSHEGTFPVAIIGIEPELEAPVGLLADNIAAGRYLTAQDGDQLLVGQALADRLEVGVGDRVTLIGRAPHEQMRRRTMTIVGIYDLGIDEVEKGLVYISLAEAQALYNLRDQATEVNVVLRSIGQEEHVVAALSAELPGVEVDPWYVTDPTTKQTMEMEKGIMSLFGLVILVIAGVGILNLLLMAVFERTREIGILAAIGMKRWETMVLFLLEGTFIGLLGALAGCVVGGLINLYFGQVGLPWAAQEYSELTALLGDRIYFDVGIGLLLNRGLTVLIIAAVAALYPAWQASRREPAEALHYV
ncbi:MAG: ABC transporter permease [Anaerolineae bacterium]|nr:ABC transporter permease [Anaerolineae bacterium]